MEGPNCFFEAVFALKTRSGDYFALATDDGQRVSAAATSDAVMTAAASAHSAGEEIDEESDFFLSL